MQDARGNDVGVRGAETPVDAGQGGRGSRPMRPWRTSAGAWILAIIAGACLLSLPWSCGAVKPAGGGGQVPRYEAGDYANALQPPWWWPGASAEGGRWWLGTDRQGRDVLARCLAGGAVSLLIGLSAAALTVAIGTAYGLMAGYAGGRTDALMMRVVDILFGLPTMLLVVLLAVGADGMMERLGASDRPGARATLNLGVLLIAIGGVSWLTMARVIRGQVLSLRGRPFMEACRALGVPRRRQLLLHLLPNLVGPMVVYAALAVPAAILSESFLSFLGIGVRPPVPSWGNLAADGLPELNLVHSRWWLLLFPCLLVGVTLLSLNFIADRLRERLDPAARGRVPA
ncbi:MAG: ABC transporter permease [Phycisphaerales bacterium]